MKNLWIKANDKTDLIDLVDEVLETEGWYAGLEVGEITEREKLRTYHLLRAILCRLVVDDA